MQTDCTGRIVAGWVMKDPGDERIARYTLTRFG